MFRKLLIICIGFHYGLCSQLGLDHSQIDQLLSAQSIAKQNFDSRIVDSFSPQLNVVFDVPKDVIFETLDYALKQRLVHSFGSIVDKYIDSLIEVSQQSIEVVLQFKNQVFL